jgi:hypothetical protein
VVQSHRFTRRTPISYVYLIGSRTFRWYKIGKAKSARIRLEHIGILLPFKIELFAVWKAWSTDAEQRMHRKYAKQRINGEWFHFGDKELNSLISESQENMTLIEGALTFTNMERDCPEGEILHVKARKLQLLIPQKVLEHILVRKLKQAAREF